MENKQEYQLTDTQAEILIGIINKLIEKTTKELKKSYNYKDKDNINDIKKEIQSYKEIYKILTLKEYEKSEYNLDWINDTNI